jgi:hypothetical protein
MLVIFLHCLVLQDTLVGSLQSSENEDEHHRDFLWEFHVQTPYVRKRHRQKYEISNDVRHCDPNEEFRNIDARAAYHCRVPDLSDRSACEDRSCFLHRMLAGRSPFPRYLSQEIPETLTT